MRSVFWLLGIASLAVALALIMGDNQASVTLFWPPHRYDAAFNVVLLTLVALFVLLYLALRAVALLRALPAQARRWRTQQIERAAVAAVLDALSNQLAGRFVRAQAAGLSALEKLRVLPDMPWAQKSQLQMLAHLLVAESAQALQNRTVRDLHLQASLQPSLSQDAPVAHEGALLRAVHWAIEDRDAPLALSRLRELPQGAARRTLALRLRLRAARLSGATAEALETAHLLTKHRAFSPEVSRSILRSLVLDAVREAHDQLQLETVWQRLDKRERAIPELALAAAARANTLARQVDADERREVTTRVRAWLEPLWSHWPQLDTDQQRQLVMLLEQGMAWLDADWLARLEQGQGEYPGNPFLQYIVGQACMHRGLWGKAAQLLGQASHSLQDTALLRRTWCALAELAEERGDTAEAQAAWRRAALLTDVQA